MNDIIITNEISHNIINEKNNITNDKNNILEELIKNQLITVDYDKKFTLLDIKRLVNNIQTSIFSDNCCIWSGYIINSKKNSYISFFIKNKKIALHRLLYCNFIGPLSDNEYIKYTCKNKGICCSIKHFKKVDNNKILDEKIIEPIKKNVVNNKVYFTLEN